MRCAIWVSVFGVVFSMAGAAWGECGCQSVPTEEAVSPPVSDWEAITLLRGPVLATIELAGPRARTFIDIKGNDVTVSPEGELSSGAMVVQLSDQGGRIIRASVVSIDAVAPEFMVPGFPIIPQTTWTESAAPGFFDFNFNNNTVSGGASVDVTGGMTQQNIFFTLNGTFDPLAVGDQVAINVIGHHEGELNYPTGVAVATVTGVGGALLLLLIAGIGLAALRRKPAPVTA